MNGDNILRLPVNPNAPVNEGLADQIFGPVNPKMTEAIARSLKAPLIVAIIVGIMLHPLSDEFVSKISSSDNVYSVMAIKMALAAVLFYFISHWSLSRGN